MKIRLAICIGSLIPAGAENLVVQMIKNLDTNKYDIHLFVLEKQYETYLEDEVSLLDIKTTYLNKKEGFSLKTILKLYNLLKNFQPHIVHGHLGGAIYASLYCWFYRVKMVHTVHTLANEELFGLKRLMFRVFYKLKIVIPVGVSNNVTQSVKKLYHLKYHLKTINNGVDIKRFYCLRNFEKNIVIGHVGRFEKVKNHQTIIEVFNKISQIYLDIQLILVGEGSQRSAIEQLVRSYQLTHRVSFVGRTEEVNNYLEKVDIFFMPSIYEGLPLSIIEAMAAGCVIVASNVGGISDIVINNRNGFLIVDPFNEEAFKESIIKLINDKDQRIMMSKQNVVDSKNFTIEEMTKKYELLYKELIK